MAINVSEEPGVSLFTHILKHQGNRLIRNFGTRLPNNMMFMQNCRYLNSHCHMNLTRTSHKNFSMCLHFLHTAQERNYKKSTWTRSRLLSLLSLLHLENAIPEMLFPLTFCRDCSWLHSLNNGIAGTLGA